MTKGEKAELIEEFVKAQDKLCRCKGFFEDLQELIEDRLFEMPEDPKRKKQQRKKEDLEDAKITVDNAIDFIDQILDGIEELIGGL